jgi:uncharacterized protein
MKLHPATFEKHYLFTAVEENVVKINHQPYQGQLILKPDLIISDWTQHSFESLVEADFETLAALGCQIILLGTGSKLRFPSPHLLRPIAEAGIGLEVMDLAAACRTFNILVTEGRSVAAALLFDAKSL